MAPIPGRYLPVRAIVPAVLLTFLLPLTVNAQQPRVSTKGVASSVTSDPSTSQIAAAATPATVTIITLGVSGDTLGLGSGFIVNPSGIIVTNHHVIRGASAAVVILANGERFNRVEAVDGDAAADVAVIKVPGYGLPVLSSSAIVPDVGAKVVAIGSPRGLSQTVSEGIVSARRILDGRELVQISAPISPGSSGGPVLDAQGRVFAIATSQITDGQQLNFAVPVRYALGLVSEPLQLRPLIALTGGSSASQNHEIKNVGGANLSSAAWDVDSSDVSAVYDERSYMARLLSSDSTGVIMALMCQAGKTGFVAFVTPAPIKPSGQLLLDRFPSTRISYRFDDHKAKTGLLLLPDSALAAWPKNSKYVGGLPWDEFWMRLYYAKNLTVAFEGAAGEEIVRFTLPKNSGDVARKYVTNCKE
jgi:S1-C subfamily serine protease